MNPILVVLIGATVVVAYDTVGSFLSRSLGFNYAWLTFGSIFIYSAVGVLASRDSLMAGLWAALIVGVIDATLGWYISWIIGPGRIDEGLSGASVILTIVFAASLAAVSGTVAALAARALRL